MATAFHIDFPFEVAETCFRAGEHPALCQHAIPLACTIIYRRLSGSAFTATRQYYINSLLTIDLMETTSTDTITLSISPKKKPVYVLSVVLDGHFHFGSPTRHWEASAPGAAYLARISGHAYPIQLPSGTGRLISIAIHTAQLAVIGEDFAELAALLAGNPLMDDYYSPSIQSDRLFMRRLIKLISPPSMQRRKAFNLHIQAHLQGVFSAFKGLLNGKGQTHYNRQKLDTIVAHIRQETSRHGQPPSLASVIDFACVSPEKLQQLFKAGLGTAPQDYLQALKMDAIKQALLCTDEPVYALAATFGYSDAAALNKPFKRRFGLSPQQLRQQRGTCPFPDQNPK
ncbi:helix-turn-helix transcriptional regulator [Parapedobacter koreensis]|uniref:Helix-turn-helix domain-containing protein n=1 Tax=Parapedobacter koreensis TaxID=332977 RepID=A0A1H7K1R3_9SPHI|nr:helix-turn-helix transcriptional regulator [Parapedobacter koreensis]SEK80749.1 Helix-turn-helix domain-containing protein [Parapedobacter koreensis]